ncbi:MAG: hypothetical protein AB7O43_17730 [Hyphomicrobiaceae bacterium]
MLARVHDDGSIEYRDDTLVEAKLHLWRPVVYEGEGPLVETLVEADRVRVVRSERPLNEIKADLLRQIDEQAESVRLRYITPGAGMAMTYLEKFAQAQAVDGLGETSANALSAEDRVAQFPTLSASVGIEAETLWDCAQLVISKYEQWAAVSNVIETARQAGKKAISDASDAASARAAYQAVTWPSP